ncbi:MAG: hypothetical protein K0U34_02915, partial [Alphaproteobacteria bacterium]|nr:hypothetical protein [Alphaproteobacteria bacterium]
FQMHPSLRTLSSNFPIYEIWRTNHEDDEVQSLQNCAYGQSLLIARSTAGVETHTIPDDGIAMINLLSKGNSLGQVFEALSPALTHKDFSETLSTLLACGAVTKIESPALQTA